ncbi:MAG: outer membrane beta-barrel protein [Bacteroidia bacterium]|nr:outer membrane beta-barrel protein [Bacteroidia bacterium]
MKKGFFNCVAIATLMVFLSAGSVFAAENSNTGFYVGLSGGYVIPQTMEYSDPYYTADKFDITLDNGYFLSIKTGWNTPFTRRIMAMEIEYNYINNNFDNSKIVPSPVDGYPATLNANMSIHAVLFNIKARYPEGPIHPYAGFGWGYAYASVGDITDRAYDGSGTYILSGESGGGFCWQFLAGLDFDIAPHMSLGIGYKYFVAYPRIGDKYDDGIYADLDYRASIITLGLNFTF